MVASFILIIHGFTFLVPPDSEAEDTDMMRTIGKWLGFEWDWMRHFTPYAQVHSLPIVRRWTHTGRCRLCGGRESSNPHKLILPAGTSIGV